MFRLLTKWRRAERTLHREWGRVPNFDELSLFLGLSESQKSMVAKAHQARDLKLEGGMGPGAGHRSPEELGDRYEPAESMIEAEDERQMLLDRLERLDFRERTVLALRYGLEGEEPMSLKEIGRRLGVTHEWVARSRAAPSVDSAAPTRGPWPWITQPQHRRIDATPSSPPIDAGQGDEVVVPLERYRDASLNAVAEQPQARPSSKTRDSCKPTRLRRCHSQRSRPGSARHVKEAVGSTR